MSIQNLQIALLKEKLEKLTGLKVSLQESKIITPADYDESAMMQVLEAISNMADASDMPEERACRIYLNTQGITDFAYLKTLESYALKNNYKAIAAGIRYIYTRLGESVLKEDAKDVDRINGIIAKSGGSGYKARELAQQMANSITTSDKAYNRYLAAAQILGQSSSVATVFLDRAKALGHSEATTLVKDRDDAQRAKWAAESAAALAIAKVKADQFIKAFNRQYPEGYTLSTTTSNPVQYQSGNGKTLYVMIGGDISRLTKGMSGLGDQRVVSRMHGVLHRMADKFGGRYDFNYSKPFISFDGTKK